MVGLLGYVCVYGRVYVMSTTVPRCSTNQLLAYCHLHFGHDCSLDGIGRQLSIAADNITCRPCSTRVWLLLASIRISPAGPRCWVFTRSSGRASTHGFHYAFGCVTGSNSRAHTTYPGMGRFPRVVTTRTSLPRPVLHGLSTTGLSPRAASSSPAMKRHSRPIASNIQSLSQEAAGPTYLQ